MVVVDDEQPILDLLSMKLTASGFSVQTSDRGDDGFALIQELTPDLVISDYTMPGLNGLELCRRMLDDPKTNRIPVIAFSSMWSSCETEMMQLQNVKAFLKKPFSPARIIQLARLHTGGVVSP